MSLKRLYLWFKKKSSKKPLRLSQKRITVLLVLILAFSFVSKIVYLNFPKEEYFDEAYFAFTAKRILHNDPKAWEWTSEGFGGYVYEWTHPPLSKEGMILGMKIFGENPFGWRIVGVFLGTLSILLIYLITKQILNDEVVALLTAGIVALDGLFFVMSRIAKNDIYFLFFALLCFYFYLKEKNFWSAVSFGLSLAAKWSVLLLLPIMLFTHFVFKRKVQKSYIWFLIIPPLIYLASYIPMFLTGHSFGYFFELQKKMLWFHLTLKRTHKYQSVWWMWPILLRPIRLFTTWNVRGMISDIYALGNPIIFWVGGISVAVTSLFAFFERNKKLWLIIFSYFVFFVPWAFSTREMFLYQYLPSIPFMAILTSYLLTKYRKLIIPFFAITFVLFIYFFPHLTGIKIPTGLDNSYYWFPSWR
jgi:dolichyl-phosphate-mannose--protein O-mannosyl transferase